MGAMRMFSGDHKGGSLIPKERYLTAVAVLLLTVTVGTLYHHVLNSYWLFDDLQILKHAREHHPQEYFFKPAVWQELSVSNLTPWVTLSFDIDLSLFGFQPKWFYLHHVVSLWLAAVMFYFVLRLWLPRKFATFGALLWIVSAPFGLVSELLMLRHYIEGALFMLISVFLFVVALRKELFLLSVIAAIPYFFALSAKEIYVPLLFIILLLPEKKWFFRLKYSLPFIFTFLFYIVWRYQMLGRAVGGYQNTWFNDGVLVELHRVIIRNIPESIRMLAGNPPSSHTAHFVVFVILGLLTAAALLHCFRNKKYSVLLFWGNCIFWIYLPISPTYIGFSVGDAGSYRLMFSVSLFYAALTSFMIYHLTRLTSYRFSGWLQRLSALSPFFAWTAYLACAILFVTVSANSFRWITTERKTLIRPLVVEGQFLMNADRRKLLVKSSVVPVNNYYENLDLLKRQYKKQSSPLVIYDVFAHIDDKTSSQLEGISINKYSPERDEMIDISREFLRKRTEYLSRIRKLPFDVRLQVKKGGFNFFLGPYDEGRYFLLAGYLPGIYNTILDGLPRTLQSELFGGYVKWFMRFGWQSPDGFVTFSPEVFFDFSKDQEIVWHQS